MNYIVCTWGAENFNTGCIDIVHFLITESNLWQFLLGWNAISLPTFHTFWMTKTKRDDDKWPPLTLSSSWVLSILLPTIFSSTSQQEKRDQGHHVGRRCSLNLLRQTETVFSKHLSTRPRALTDSVKPLSRLCMSWNFNWQLLTLHLACFSHRWHAVRIKVHPLFQLMLCVHKVGCKNKILLLWHFQIQHMINSRAICARVRMGWTGMTMDSHSEWQTIVLLNFIPLCCYLQSPSTLCDYLFYRGWNEFSIIWLGAPVIQAAQPRGDDLKVCIDPNESLSIPIPALHKPNSDIRSHTTTLAPPNMAKIQIICWSFPRTQLPLGNLNPLLQHK